MIEDILQGLAEKYDKKYAEVVKKYIRDYRIITRLYPYADKDYKIRQILKKIELEYRR